MQEAWEFLSALLRPDSIIQYGGLTLLLVVLFLENGVPIGIFLPGDSLIFTAGLFNASGYLDHSTTLVAASMFTAGAAGYWFGWWTGRTTGSALRRRPDSFWFRRRHLEVAETYYHRYGGRLLLVGRFLPIVRTFAPIMAGMVGMPLGRFSLYNLGGMVLWMGSLFTLGWWAGREFPWIEHYLGWIVIGLVISTGVPVFLRLREKRREAGKEKSQDPET